MTPEEPRNDSLERAILERPEESSGYLVLADWLMQLGHPRGELIALQHRAEIDGGSLVREHELRTELFPEAARLSPEWRWGFIRELVVNGAETPPDTLEEVLRHPSCRFLQRLRAHNVEPSFLQAASSSLRWLHLTTYGVTHDFPELARTLPRLRHLALIVDAVTGAGAEFPELNSLDLLVRSSNPSTIEAVSSAMLPRLRELSIYGLRSDPLSAAQFLRAGLPMLESLALHDMPLDANLASALLAAPWTRSLKRLRLFRCFSDPLVARTVRRDPRLERLERLEIEPQETWR